MSKLRTGGMGGPMGIMGGGPRAVEKSKDFKGTMKKLGVYLKTYSLYIDIVILFSIGSAAISIVG
ncbi:ABC transporter ATP-binding protein, partial [Clostridium perfringens]